MTTGPRLCFIGNMLGRNPGFVTTQGQIAADLFKSAGYSVISASARVNRMMRLGDMIQTVLLNRHKVDVLIVEVYSGPSFVIADVISFLCRCAAIPVVGVLHGGNLPAFSKRFPSWTRRVLKRFDSLVAPSSYLAKELRVDGVSPQVIPNIIDLSAYRFRVRKCPRPVMLWMRAFHEIYNPSMALQVLTIVKQEYGEARLVMAGADKGLQQDIKRQAAALGLSSSVTFPGFLGQDEKLAALASADIFLNTNTIDNMPVALVEACAAGMPIVSTDVGGIPHLITQDQTGLLVPSGDAKAMSKMVIRVLNDRELAEKLSMNGRLLAERSAWTSVRERWDQVFADLITKRNADSHLSWPRAYRSS